MWQRVEVRSKVVVEVAAKEVEVVVNEGNARLDYMMMVCVNGGWISCLGKVGLTGW